MDIPFTSLVSVRRHAREGIVAQVQFIESVSTHIVMRQVVRIKYQICDT